MSATKRLISPMKEKHENDVKKQKLCKDLNLKFDEKSLPATENYDYLFNDDDFDLSEFDKAELKAADTNCKLDLSKWQRCIVEDLERERHTFDLVLLLSAKQKIAKVDGKENADASNNDSMQSTNKCHLQGPWSHTHLEVGDTVSVCGIWDEQLQAYKVDKDHGFIVTNPDTLLTSTSVVGSLFCRRKAVLQERFRGVDANNKVMVVGTLVHELLQTVLAKDIASYKDICTAAEELLQSRETAYMLYGSLLTREDMQSEIYKFVPNILAFVEQYIKAKEPAVLRKEQFQGKITEIQDIEENLWVPQLGIKGKVDVSVHVRHRQNPLNGNTIPLELKTGRASFSMEHKGQIILYQMMLSAIGHETRSGLLLYLRDGIMSEIFGARNEQRDLIVLRNDLSHYIARLPASLTAVKNSADEAKSLPFELPEPISHPTACKSCAYATICCTFAKNEAHLELTATHPLSKLMPEALIHLKLADFEYFMHWCRLLTLEDQEAKKSNYARALWTETAASRAQQGRALIDLQLMDNVIFEESRYIHTFQLMPENDAQNELEAQVDFTLTGFSIGEYVVVSSLKRLAIAAGCISELTNNKICVSLERDLRKKYDKQTFIIDKHESQSGNVFNFTNLGLLLDDTERAAALRAIIIERQQPSYHKVLPKVVATEGASILQSLNAVQRAAALKALTTQSFMLIKGLPGTGKTQTLVAIVRLLHLMGKTVLITSYTHSAVDNLLLRLTSFNLPMLRLGSSARIKSELQQCSEGFLMKNCNTETELTEKYATFPIVACTCLAAGHSIFLHRNFDYCIVDEATQVMQSTVLRPLYFCEKFILVGDPDQLPPLIRSREARLSGADESLFQRLDSAAATATLTLQYRMNKTITKLANELTYGGGLQCAADNIKVATMKLPTMTINGKCEKWLKRALQTHVDQAVFLLDTLDCAERSQAFALAKHSSTCAAIEQAFVEEQPSVSDESPLEMSPNTKRKCTRKRLSKYTNYCDAAIVFRLVEFLLNAGYEASRIGIIAPYRVQVELLRKLAAQYDNYYEALDFAAIEVNTVDQYQGRDKDIILYSCSRTGSAADANMERSREAEILEDKRRLTVAITRAKFKLILVGDVACLQQYTPFRLLLSHIPSYCKLQLSDDKLDFHWQTLLEQLGKIIST